MSTAVPRLVVLVLAGAALLTHARTGATIGVAAAQVPAPAPEPPCAVSTDAGYAFSPERAAEVGGGAMYAGARQRRYLGALRGPQGQPVRYTRSGTVMPPGTDDPIDRYEVTYDGLAAPLVLYLDAYHFLEPKAPAGFLCGGAMQLSVPPPDQLRAADDLDALAAAIAAAPGFRPAPVDLGGEPPLGLVVDGFRLRARRVRPGGAAPPADPRIRTLVVAYPQTCGGRTVSADRVALVGEGGQQTEPDTLVTEAAAVRAHMPGQSLPAGSIIATFTIDALLTRAQVRVTFADAACPTPTRDSALAYTGARLVEAPMPPRPPGDTSGVAWLGVSAIVDHQGTFQAVRAMGGPALLREAAEAAVRQWKARPPRADEAPLAAPVTLQVSFAPPR